MQRAAFTRKNSWGQSEAQNALRGCKEKHWTYLERKVAVRSVTMGLLSSWCVLESLNRLS